MTRFNKYLAFAATAVGAIVSSGAMAAGNLSYQNLPAGQTTCTNFTSTSVDGTTGDLVINCKSTTPPVAGALGTIALSTTKYTGAKSVSTTPANVTISVVRNGGVTGQIDATLSVTGAGCSLAFNAIQFMDTDGASKQVNLTSSNAGTSICSLTLASTTANALGSPSTATVDVTDASAPPPPIAGCPTTPANVVMGTVLTSGLAGRIVDKARTDGLPPTIYSYPLPRNAIGGFFTTRDPDTPPSLTVTLSISKCPGDFSSATTDPTEVYHYSFMPNVPFYPCVGGGSAESASLWWGTSLAQNTCLMDVTKQYYANIRITDQNGVYSCPLASATGPGCPLRFWWN
jgi:hypothetical protein